MGFLDKLFPKKTTGITERPTYSLNDYMSGIVPIYTSGFGNNIYASDVVQQAIYSIVSEIKKLDIVHVKSTGNDYTTVQGNIQQVLDNPNPLMTTSDYLEKIIWNLLLNYNSFVYPIWNGNTLVALYPLQPREVDFFQNESGAVEIQFTFPNGVCSGRIPYENIIHMRYHYSVSDYMGGNEYGAPDFAPLLETLKLNDTLLKGLAKSLNLQCTINGIVKTKTMKNTDEQIQMIKEFEQKMQQGKSGILPLDITSDYVPITKQVQLLDQTVLKFIDEKILRTFGVPIEIINGNYSKEIYEAFFQKVLEPIIKSMSQAHTRGIFSRREALGFNNKIMLYAKELIFMGTQQKIEYFNMLVDTSSCYKNELRTAFGMRPLPELEGQLAESSNKTNAENNKAEAEGGGE